MTESANGQRRMVNRLRLRTLEPAVGERHASWFELFFDLVFVFAVSQVAHVLSVQTDLMGLLKYLALFAAVWWSWVGFTYYADRFETDEAAYRVTMFAAMLAVIGLSLAVGNAFSPEGDVSFVVCYGLVVLLLVLLYVRAAYYVPLARGFSLQFITGLGGAVGLLLLSLLLAPPFRYLIWAAAFLLELATPFLNIRLARAIPIDRSHIPERFGLFTIIVLGEAVIVTANSAASVEWNLTTVTTACIGFAMAACIWWINFDFVEDAALRSPALLRRLVYLYGHFFIVSSIVAIGVGVEHAIKESVEPHLHLPTLALLSIGIAVYFGATMIVRLIVGVCNLFYVRIAAIASLLTVPLVGGFLPPLVVVAGLFAILAGAVWLETQYGNERLVHESPVLVSCEHEGEMQIFRPRRENACEECRKNNYKWVHLRLCLSCGHVGCCDTSVNKHATKHFHKSGHPIMASLETGEQWAWCYADDRFVPLEKHVERLPENAPEDPGGNMEVSNA
jgi:low temperature requirement protein LtrA